MAMFQQDAEINLIWEPFTQIKDVNDRSFPIISKNYLIILNLSKEDPNYVDVFCFLQKRWSRRRIIGEKVMKREGYTVCVTAQNKVVIYGGKDQNGFCNNYLVLIVKTGRDGADLEWQYNPRFIGNDIPKRFQHTSNIYEDKMLVFGGCDSDENVTNTLCVLHFRDAIWTILPSEGYPPKRHLHFSFISKENLYIGGGYYKEFMYNDFHVLNLRTMIFTEVQNPGFTAGLEYFVAPKQYDSQDLYIFEKKPSGFGFYLFKEDENILKPIECVGNVPEVKNFHGSLLQYENKRLVCNLTNQNENYSTIYSITAIREFLPNPNKVLPQILSQTDTSPSKTVLADKVEPLISNLRQLFKERLFPDIIFEVEQEKIPAHKAILASRSDYFRRMLTSGMIEANSTSIKVDNVKASVFNAILEYMYCNEITLDESLAFDLLPQSEEYLMQSLKDSCEKFLTKSIKIENVLEYLTLADTYGAENLKNNCLDFVIKNLSSVENTRQITELPKHIYLDILKQALKNKNPNSLIKS